MRAPNKNQSNFTISRELVSNSLRHAQVELEKRKNLEENLFRQLDRTSGIDVPTKFHQRFSPAVPPEFQNLVDSAIKAELTMTWILKEGGVSADQLVNANATYLLEEWVHCNKEASKPCPADVRFRSLDGSCNNLVYPFWGSAFQPHRRILPSVYDNNMTTPRTLSVRAKSLPSARQVSTRFTNVTSWTAATEKKLSMLFLTWGQFIDHDLVSTAASKGPTPYLHINSRHISFIHWNLLLQ